MCIKNWIVNQVDREAAFKTAEECGVSVFISSLLNLRGIGKKADVNAFLNAQNDFSNPFDFVDMTKLVSIVNKNIKNNGKICVFGDYDADGISATALVYSYLKSKNANVIYFIPSREHDGYGLNTRIIDNLHEQNVKLIFTVDNGISAFDEIEYANKLGIETVVTDHHRQPEKLPNAAAIVDPYRLDCKSEFKCFAGVGVAFKAICALENSQNPENLMNEYLDLLAIGTIGDSIELVGESRDLVKAGLKVIEIVPRLGVQVILERSGLTNKTIDARSVAFGIVPRINACGRMGDASRAVELLLSKNYDEAMGIFDELETENEMRKMIEDKIRLEVEQKIESDPNIKNQRIIVVSGEGWHHGVIGIVASRITEKYGKPSILITYTQNNARGSSRSIEDFSILEVIKGCQEHLERFGGHPMAAGINLKTENIQKFTEAVINFVNSYEDIPFSKLTIDCKLKPEAISLSMAKQLEMLMPFGNGNKEPIFGLYSMRLTKISPVGGGKHLRLTFSHQNAIIQAMYFKKQNENFLYNVNDVLDLAVTLHKNIFMGTESCSIFIVNIKISEMNNLEILHEKRIFERFMLTKKLNFNHENFVPQKDDFKLVYSFLTKNIYSNHRIDYICNKTKIRAFKIYLILEVLAELNLIKTNWKSDEFTFEINKPNEKINLDNSKLLNILKQQ